MKDIVFYPLILAVVAAIVVFALNMGGERVRLSPADIARQGYGLSGTALVDLTASPGTELTVNSEGASALMVQARADAVPSAGVFLTIPPVAEATFAGRPITITWRIRRGEGFGAVELGYFTLGAGDLAWQTVEIDEGFQDVVQTFTPGPNDEPNSKDGFDYAGLWPGVGDPDSVPVIIKSVRVRLAE